MLWNAPRGAAKTGESEGEVVTPASPAVQRPTLYLSPGCGLNSWTRTLLSGLQCYMIRQVQELYEPEFPYIPEAQRQYWYEAAVWEHLWVPKRNRVLVEGTSVSDTPHLSQFELGLAHQQSGGVLLQQ